MKSSEEIYLKDISEKFNKCLKSNKNISYFYDNDLKIKNISLQKLSFKSDLDFFNEVAFILSVIASIINHPHLLNKGEEVVIRSEIAPELSSEMFLKTIKDSRLWKEDDNRMVPENVYYYQQIDEIKIYENIFIVNLIKRLGYEIDKYKEFYLEAIGSLPNSLTSQNDNVSKALDLINLLERKIKHIKNTYFFKAINKEAKPHLQVIPTNILLKDRLYNYCYKFYKKLISYKDRFKVLSDIRLYYYLKLLTALRTLNFTIVEDKEFIVDNEALKYPKVSFKNDDFTITIEEDYLNIGLILTITNRNIKNKNINTSKNLLIFDDHTLVDDINIHNKENYDSIYSLTLWNLSDLLANKEIFNSIKTEDILIKEYLDSRLMVKEGSSTIYTRYCPACKSRLVNSDKNLVYFCDSCKSRYVFYKNKDNINDRLWFIDLRRGSNDR